MTSLAIGSQSCDPRHLPDKALETVRLSADFQLLAPRLFEEYGQEITVKALAELAAQETADDLVEGTVGDAWTGLLQDIAALNAGFAGSVLLRDALAQIRLNGRPAQPHVLLDDPEAWQHVCQGLRLARTSLSVTFLAALALATFTYVLVLGGESAINRGAVLKVINIGGPIAILAGLGGVFFLLFGQTLCCKVPSASGAKSWASVSVFIFAAAPVGAVGFLPLAQALYHDKEERFEMLTLVLQIGAGWAIAGHLVFVIALCKIGRFFKNDAVVRLGTSYLTACTILMVGIAAFDAVLFANNTPAAPRLWLEVYIEAVEAGNNAKAHLTRVAVFGIPTIIGLLCLGVFANLVKRIRDVVTQTLLQQTSPGLPREAVKTKS